MYGCESWTIKKAECQKIYAFELWFWRRPLRVLWTAARRSNQSILKDISPEYSLEVLMLNLIWGKIEGRRRRGWQRMILFDDITNAMDMIFSKLWEKVMNRKAWYAAVHGVAKSWMWQSNWTKLNWTVS